MTRLPVESKGKTIQLLNKNTKPRKARKKCQPGFTQPDGFQTFTAKTPIKMPFVNPFFERSGT